MQHMLALKVDFSLSRGPENLDFRLEVGVVDL
jgi:hypothetical protein